VRKLKIDDRDFEELQSLIGTGFNVFFTIPEFLAVNLKVKIPSFSEFLKEFAGIFTNKY
jgi:hypothetical protein